jgi:hypothetical protein
MLSHPPGSAGGLATGAFQLAPDLERALVSRVLRRLPPLATAGPPIRLAFSRALRDRQGPVHGGAFLRERKILFDCTRAELPRIFVHELFHFVWLRAGNPVRLSFERLIAREISGHARGELGWAAESRKQKLAKRDARLRTRQWRDYCCESFCDTAAWLYAGLSHHPEFTLAKPRRARRRQWFEHALALRLFSI